MNTTCQTQNKHSIDFENKHLVEYYEAFELILEKARSINEYRTHFGIMEKPVEGHCFFRAIAQSHLYPEMTNATRAAMDQLHEKIFYNFDYQHQPKKILDVGFGAGGTLKQLLDDWNACLFEGINLNPVQHEIAGNYLKTYLNVKLHLGNFLDYRFSQQFDLIYFIESAFHIQDKESLCRQLAHITKEGGHIFIVDVFYSEELMKRMANKPSEKEEIFDYLSINQWEELCEKHKMEIVDFEDISQPVAKHTKVSISIEDFKNQVLKPLLEKRPDKDIMGERLIEAHKGYARLSKLLEREFLQYGILRLRKKQ